MGHVMDQEFEVPVEKGFDWPVGVEPPASRFATFGLIFSLLGVSFLPLLGSFLAILLGHFALLQIRESRGRLGGRWTARFALTLGYVTVTCAFVAWSTLAIISSRSWENIEVATLVHEAATQVRGVKMVNEMDRGDFALIRSPRINVVNRIIAFYNAGKPSSDPEFALLTHKTISYYKDGHPTIFELADVEEIKDDQEYGRTYGLDSPSLASDDVYRIEVREKRGPRMRICITPKGDGVVFLDALRSAWKLAGGGAKEASKR